jgi:hypothetical protein
MIKSLAYFDDAEREPSLNMIQPIDWSEVKAFFEEEQKSLLEDFLKKHWRGAQNDLPAKDIQN